MRIFNFKFLSSKSIFFYLILSASMSIIAQKNNALHFLNKEHLDIQGYLQSGINAVAETNLFWNLADVPELDFNSDTEWLELYMKPGIGLEYKTESSNILYTKVSAVGSYTWGIDAFDAQNTGRITLEDAYLGYRFNILDSISFDVSVGSRPLKLGTGMLISNGASSGFERGALKLGPRKAWEKSAIIEVVKNQLNSKIFYIAPNELPSNDTNNELIGLDFNYSSSKNKYLGISYINVLQSDAPYPKAALNGDGPPIITIGDRKGLNALNLYGKTNPVKNYVENLYIAMDLAYQWNTAIDLTAWGGRIQLGYSIAKLPWKPTFMYSYQVFSGDDPDTFNQERFDPLYFEGSPSAWSTGSKSSMVFINSNVQSNGITVRLQPFSKDIITLRYAHITAQQSRSPIQFGQAARIEFSDEIPTVIAGVTNNKLADDIFIEYNKIIGKNLFINAGFSISFPGKGIHLITNNTSNWTGGFINFVFNY